MKKLLFFTLLGSGLSYAECPSNLKSTDLMRIANLELKEFGGVVNQRFLSSLDRQNRYCRQSCEFMANTWNLGFYQGHGFIDINFKDSGICRICKCNLS